MKTMNNDKLDSLLHESLKSTIEPSEKFNSDLKREIRLNADKRVVNIWYVPLLIAVVFDICIGAFFYIFLPSIMLKVILFLMIFVSLFCILCFTLVGLRFELKKGSVMKI